MNLLTDAETLPFGIAFALILGIALLEGIGILLSYSPSTFLDSLLPDIDSDSGLDRILGWLHIGKVPALVSLVLFLTGYALFGYSLQLMVRSLFGHYLPGAIAGIVALPAGLATARHLGTLLAHLIPRDETSAVSELSLIGRTGVVSEGHARRHLAAQARVQDAYGHTHYLMIEPDINHETLEEGTSILVVRKVGAIYYCIPNPHPTLL